MIQYPEFRKTNVFKRRYPKRKTKKGKVQYPELEKPKRSKVQIQREKPGLNRPYTTAKKD